MPGLGWGRGLGREATPATARGRLLRLSWHCHTALARNMQRAAKENDVDPVPLWDHQNRRVRPGGGGGAADAGRIKSRPNFAHGSHTMGLAAETRPRAGELFAQG